jgi:hypothetical protein
LQLVKDAEEQNKFGGAVTNPADLADMPDPKSMMPDSAELLEKAKAKPRPFSATSGNFAVVLASSGQPNTECNLDVAWGSYPPSDLDLKELEAWVQAELLPGSKIKERHFDE